MGHKARRKSCRVRTKYLRLFANPSARSANFMPRTSGTDAGHRRASLLMQSALFCELFLRLTYETMAICSVACWRSFVSWQTCGDKHRNPARGSGTFGYFSCQGKVTIPLHKKRAVHPNCSNFILSYILIMHSVFIHQLEASLGELLTDFRNLRCVTGF